MGDAHDFLYGAALIVEFAYAFDGVCGWHGVSFRVVWLEVAEGYSADDGEDDAYGEVA